ncbi:MAG: hypothetical protein O7F16_10480 [Acidobacteria bacterium]|nr:hypothetical protein [Acidobacteriota bacterium]
MTGPQSSLIERLLGRRRSFLVEWRYQLRSSLVPVVSVALLLVLFIVTIHLSNADATRQLVESAPNLQALLEGQDRTQLFLTLCAAGVYLMAVIILGLIDSHRTVGALHHVEKRLTSLRNGDWRSPMVLRHSDNFQDLGDALNVTLSYLRSHLEEDVSSLDEAIDRLEETVAPGHPLGELRRILVALRSRKKSLLHGGPMTSSQEEMSAEQEVVPVGLS